MVNGENAAARIGRPRRPPPLTEPAAPSPAAAAAGGVRVAAEQGISYRQGPGRPFDDALMSASNPARSHFGRRES